MHEKCTISRQKIQKIYWQPPPQTPLPLRWGHPLPKSHILCSNIVDDKTVTEML